MRGTLNPAKIKGTHTAMKSGMIAAEAVFEALNNQVDVPDYKSKFNSSWLYEELYKARNFSSSIHKFGSVAGGWINTDRAELIAGKG